MFKNDAPGLEPSLVSAPLSAGEVEFDRGSTTRSTPTGARPVGPGEGRQRARAAAPANLPKLHAHGPTTLKNDPVSGMEAAGAVTNRSKVEQKALIVYCVARKGSRVVAAGRRGDPAPQARSEARLPRLFHRRPERSTGLGRGSPDGAPVRKERPHGDTRQLRGLRRGARRGSALLPELRRAQGCATRALCATSCAPPPPLTVDAVRPPAAGLDSDDRPRIARGTRARAHHRRADRQDGIRRQQAGGRATGDQGRPGDRRGGDPRHRARQHLDRFVPERLAEREERLHGRARRARQVRAATPRRSPRRSRTRPARALPRSVRSTPTSSRACPAAKYVVYSGVFTTKAQAAAALKKLKAKFPVRAGRAGIRDRAEGSDQLRGQEQREAQPGAAAEPEQPERGRLRQELAETADHHRRSRASPRPRTTRRPAAAAAGARSNERACTDRQAPGRQRPPWRRPRRPARPRS